MAEVTSGILSGGFSWDRPFGTVRDRSAAPQPRPNCSQERVKNSLPIQGVSCDGTGPAKPCTPVRFRSPPLSVLAGGGCFFVAAIVSAGWSCAIRARTFPAELVAAAGVPCPASRAGRNSFARQPTMTPAETPTPERASDQVSDRQTPDYRGSRTHDSTVTSTGTWMAGQPAVGDGPGRVIGATRRQCPGSPK
jgi:hypothetical protein